MILGFQLSKQFFPVSMVEMIRIEYETSHTGMNCLAVAKCILQYLVLNEQVHSKKAQ
jgi:hypothetical protein